MKTETVAVVVLKSLPVLLVLEIFVLDKSLDAALLILVALRILGSERALELVNKTPTFVGLLNLHVFVNEGD